MINPTWVSLAASALQGTGIPVGVVIGFPLGATLSASKRDETARVLKHGAHDIDMVLNIGLLKSAQSSDYELVRQDIRGVVELAHGAGAIVKVILETCLLTFEEKLRASEIALSAGANFLKTSTGFSTGGATADDISLLRGVAGDRAGVKASGGIRSLADATTMLRAGASRIGASASVKIVSRSSLVSSPQLLPAPAPATDHGMEQKQQKRLPPTVRSSIIGSSDVYSPQTTPRSRTTGRASA